ncbi:UNKNOWN [Stylonychia lemnae]|uniref:Uncharacterized protein n=1 Tax=Stylonychia lemnae TaxID=5949 RepID=A0A077ZX41_STYLE|nr:UNKNOWN [Stylonychia lemnae]|eukprot:CDW73807.1 UNKNOWN [Stylonychia lemnae]
MTNLARLKRNRYQQRVQSAESGKIFSSDQFTAQFDPHRQIYAHIDHSKRYAYFVKYLPQNKLQKDIMNIKQNFPLQKINEISLQIVDELLQNPQTDVILISELSNLDQKVKKYQDSAEKERLRCTNFNYKKIKINKRKLSSQMQLHHIQQQGQTEFQKLFRQNITNMNFNPVLLSCLEQRIQVQSKLEVINNKLEKNLENTAQIKDGIRLIEKEVTDMKGKIQFLKNILRRFYDAVLRLSITDREKNRIQKLLLQFKIEPLVDYDIDLQPKSQINATKNIEQKELKKSSDYYQITSPSGYEVNNMQELLVDDSSYQVSRPKIFMKSRESNQSSPQVRDIRLSDQFLSSRNPLNNNNQTLSPHIIGKSRNTFCNTSQGVRVMFKSANLL